MKKLFLLAFLFVASAKAQSAANSLDNLSISALGIGTIINLKNDLFIPAHEATIHLFGDDNGCMFSVGSTSLSNGGWTSDYDRKAPKSYRINFNHRMVRASDDSLTDYYIIYFDVLNERNEWSDHADIRMYCHITATIGQLKSSPLVDSIISPAPRSILDKN